MRIYVGNLSYDTTQDALSALFAQHGEVTDLHLPTDRETGRPRGFAFVEMADDQAQAAIDALDGKDVDGRALKVNQARERSGGGGGGGGGGGRGGGGGGGGRRW